MNDTQIRQLDRCRNEQKKLLDVQSQINELFKTLGTNHNGDLGSEINQIFRDLKESVITSIGNAHSEIHKLITNI